MGQFSFELLPIVKKQFEKVVEHKKYQIQEIGKELIMCKRIHACCG